MDPLIPPILGAVAGVVIGAALWEHRLRTIGKHQHALVEEAAAEAREVTAAAEREARVLREQHLVAGREEALALREEAIREAEQRREEVERAERRLAQREEQLGLRQDRQREEERRVEQREQELTRLNQAVLAQQAELQEQRKEVNAALERVASLTAEEAVEEVRRSVADQARTEALALSREIRERARQDADRKARLIIAQATQRLAAEHTAETTVSTVPLPNDEMKGRVIGREGRNIRAFEAATGVDVIIDDTPDLVAISCFDPVRREVARRALTALISDGRIHPARIEGLVDKARVELEQELSDLGERAAFDVDVHGLHPDLLRLIGRMRYRSSYGQNIYEHSKEVAWLAGMMASELHGDPALARRGGLLHDVGKVLSHEHEGTHVQLGVELARKYGESELVINCIEAHHDDVPHQTMESVLVQAADAISGSRPGARREAFESYTRRLTALETIAAGYPGVDRAAVIQAGREVRVIVKPEEISDTEAQALSENIARRVELELQYPGQIKVTVIRETRAVDIAK